MTPQDILMRVRRLEIQATRLVDDMMVGAYLSHFKGRGMDFEDLREYAPGDDVRDIDWNVTHRMGRPFVKRFREERELTLAVVLDVSGSSEFGSGVRTKRELATEVAATLAVSAARSSDKVCLVLFTDQVELYVPPRKGRRHILRVVREAVAFQPRGRGTDVACALAFVNRVLRRHSIVFLLTDFLHAPRARALGELMERETVELMGLVNSRHDLVCVHLSDPRESELPAAGLLTVEDAETGETLELDSGRRGVRQAYAAVNTRRIAGQDEALRQTGVDTLQLSTSEDIQPVLQRFFETRRGRKRR